MEELVAQTREIFWSAEKRDIITFNSRNISRSDYKHWDNSTCGLQSCDICSVLTPSKIGWFSDERIFPMTNASSGLYSKLGEFEPYKIHAKRDRTEHGAPLKLLDVHSREIIYDTVGKKYFTVSHVWASDYFSGTPSSKDKGYPWLRRVSTLLDIQYAWIDICCINQSDIEEKQREIGYMRRYYSGADACAVILSSTNAKDIDEFIQNVRLLAHDSTDNPYRRLGHLWALASIFRSNLLLDEWFRRVWTIQEIMLSYKIIVDSSDGLVDLTELLRCYCVLIVSLGQMAMCTDDMDQVRTLSRYIYNKTESCDVASVLELCVGRQATNKHDYVYGVLGLLPNIHVEINYSLPFETVAVSFFREAARSGDLSWISWTGSSFLEGYSYIPTMGSYLSIDRWNAKFLNKLSVTFDDNMAIRSDEMDVEIVGMADWEGAYPGITNVCAVLYMLCVNEKLCHACLVMKFCTDGCCTPYMVRLTVMTSGIDCHLCANCTKSDSREWSDDCPRHMERLFAKNHDRRTLLMKTQGKYLVGRMDCKIAFEDTNMRVLMFGDREMGYRGWVMDGGCRVGIVSYHEKNFVINAL